MAVERSPSGSSLIDVLDRVLDKGIVIDAWVRVSLVGIDLVTVEARIVVASIDTYLKYSDIYNFKLSICHFPALSPLSDFSSYIVGESLFVIINGPVESLFSLAATPSALDESV